jgi:hypothetical protein
LTGRRRASGVTIGPKAHARGGGGDRRQRDPRVGHVDNRLSPAHVVPHEDPVPADLLRLAGETRHQRRVGQLVEQRQEQARAHARERYGTTAIRYRSRFSNLYQPSDRRLAIRLMEDVDPGGAVVHADDDDSAGGSKTCSQSGVTSRCGEIAVVVSGEAQRVGLAVAAPTGRRGYHTGPKQPACPRPRESRSLVISRTVGRRLPDLEPTPRVSRGSRARRTRRAR